jgi:hypothetical protein
MSDSEWANRCDAEARCREPEPHEVAHPLKQGFGLPPPAIMELQGNDTLVICAWCSTKAEADAWGKARGYTVSHGICPVCAATVMSKTAVAFAAAEQAAQECIARATVATAYTRGAALNLKVRRAELLGVTLDELDWRDGLDLQQMAEDLLEEERAEEKRRVFFEQSADYVAELKTEGRT